QITIVIDAADMPSIGMAKNQCWPRNLKKDSMRAFPGVVRGQAPSAQATGALQTLQSLYSLYTRAAAVAREKETENKEFAAGLRGKGGEEGPSARRKAPTKFAKKGAQVFAVPAFVCQPLRAFRCDGAARLARRRVV